MADSVTAAETVLRMGRRSYGSVVLNHAGEFTLAELDQWARDRKALDVLAAAGLDVAVVLAFRGEPVPAAWLAAAVAAGLQEGEIRAFLASPKGIPPVFALTVLAGMRLP